MIYKTLIKGLLCYIPAFKEYIKKGTGGSNSARYCYGVWMRHLIYLSENGMSHIPKSIAEIGPGDSIGVGLCALLSGTNKYFAFDIIEHASLENNLNIFDDLVELFKSKSSIPSNNEFPKLKPLLTDYKFPSNILSDEHLKNVLSSERIEKIRTAIKNLKANNEISISYIAPWDNTQTIKPNSIEMIFSQAVMEHIQDVKTAYLIMQKWLKNNGYISHQIDYKAHETHRKWYGHLTYNNFIWRIIMKGRPYIINRKLHSEHKNAIENAGLKVLFEKKTREENYNFKNLSSQFRKKEVEDLIISSGYFIAQKLILD